MTYAKLGQSGLDYQPCRYAGSRVTFRGPRRMLRGSFLAFLGGTETFGRFIPDPFVTQIERHLDTPVVNLSAINAGLDLCVNEPTILEIANRASATVVQVTGAQNLSNRFYTVHPRRNDRFVKASETLHALFPEVDFADVHFTRHLLKLLAEVNPDRFSIVRVELQTAWLARMKQILATLRGPVILLWMAEKRPPTEGADSLTQDPLFVDARMLDALAPRVATVLEVTPSGAAQAIGTEGMVVGAGEMDAVNDQLNAAAHDETTDALLPILEMVLSERAA